MARRPIIQAPDPRLAQAALPVTEFDEDLQTLINDLTDTLRANSGIGLSAPQVGDLRQVVVLDLSNGKCESQVFVNPQIIHRENFGLIQESCLSVPGREGLVMRPTKIRVRAQDAHGVTFERNLEQMNAAALGHEIDHLAGVLFIDKLSWVTKLLFSLTNRASRKTRAPA
jgi:peptide deformylase